MDHTSALHKKVTLASLLVALGIIYGDIGTSPLYVLRAIVGDRPIGHTLVFGGVSLIFWTLFFQTTVKYIWLTLKADNHGEGGVFSLFALVKRYNKGLAIIAILGATTLLADGIITPPISVASAIEGLGTLHGMAATFVPGNALTLGIVVFIISLLFFSQRFGTDRIGKAFGPVMTLWFSMILGIGLYYIVQQPDIFRALNPVYGIRLLTEYPGGFWLLGAVFLATTGAEALYSDLGHCGIRNIRITWGFVKVSLVLNYLGQAAWIMHYYHLDPARHVYLNDLNPFFQMMPRMLLFPSILVATAATIIASQALISGSFTLVSEAMNLNFWPRVTVRQPSDIKGQIYIPSVNLILWFGCLLMVMYFRTSSAMEAAYGFSITIAMLMTTILLGYYLRYRLKWNKMYVGAILTMYFLIEGSFFIANSAKIKERWMFLFFELFIFTTMYVWYYARKVKNRFLNFVDIGKYAPLLIELSQDTSVPKFCTHLIYLTKANSRHQVEEKIINSIFAKKPKRADVYWFLHIDRTEDPFTMTYDVSELVDDKIIKVNIHIGFRIQPKSEVYFKRILQDLVNRQELNLHRRPDGSTKYNPEPDFKFVVLERFMSFDNEVSFRENLLLQMYLRLRKLSLKDVKAFGLDESDVMVEKVPLILKPLSRLELQRIPVPGLAPLTPVATEA